jgi:HAMP domain-containing protein
MRPDFKQKLYLFGALMTVVMLALIGTAWHALATLSEVSIIADAIGEIRVQTLENRRREKDFLLRLDPQYPQQVAAQTQLIHNAVDKLLAYDLGDEAIELLQRIDQDAASYEQLFQEVVNLHFERGLDEELGLRGELRAKVHGVERILEASGQLVLENRMLELRRREKDYLLRGGQENVVEFERAFNDFISVGARSGPNGSWNEIEQLARNYRDAFLRIPEIDAKIDTKIEEFRELVHRVDPSVVQLAKATDQRREVLQRRARRLTSVISALGIVVCAAFIYWTAGRTTLTIRRFRRLFRRAAAGDLSGRFRALGARGKADDFPKLASEFDSMMEVLEEYVRRVRGLAGRAEGGGASEVPLPEALDDDLRSIRLKLRELECRSEDAEPVAKAPAPGVGGALVANALVALKELARQGLRLADELETDRHLSSDSQDLVEGLKRLEVISQGFVEQSRLLVRILSEGDIES